MVNSDSQSFFDTTLDAADEARLDAKAEAEIAAGQCVHHADVVRWLQSWGTPIKLPRPQSKP